ncbi:hypothetical protein [Bacillus sp. SM2101]|uniref:hypothetical protein n=1 Tax=Bacillus sp. SM2101 TaxID=2805366 RepID=UPI001BDF519B|nr:hypothetical protein [Bacillus sp. SM2101]
MAVRYLINTNKINLVNDFYKTLGFDIKSLNSNNNLISYPDSFSILVSKFANDKLNVLDDFYMEIFPNKNTIYIYTSKLTGLQEILLGNSFSHNYVENYFNSRIELTDPLGNNLIFIEQKHLSNDRIVDLYKESLDKFINIINQLEPGILDYTSPRSKWNINTIVNHLIEVDVNNSLAIKYILAEPGRNFEMNIYDCDIWVDSLNYNSFPYMLSKDLFLANRYHLLELLENKKYPLDTYILNRERRVYLKNLMKGVASHTFEHLDEIEEILKNVNKEMNSI